VKCPVFFDSQDRYCYYAPPLRVWALSDDAHLTSVAYIGPKSRTERPST